MADVEDLCDAGQRKFKKVMREYGDGELNSSSGEKITSKTRAVAVAMSEGRRVCEEG